MTNWGKFSRIVAEAKAAKKLDPVGGEDDDVNNDGTVDSSDSYLKKRRATVGAAIAADRKNKVQEELIGNQKEIDANNNGKVDAHDFALLRAKKKKIKTEDYELVDEARKSDYTDDKLPSDEKLGYGFKDNKKRRKDLKTLERLIKHERGLRRGDPMYNSYEPEGEQLNELPIVPLAIGAGALAAPYLAKKFLKPKVDQALDNATKTNKLPLATGGNMQQLRQAQNNSYELEGELVDEARKSDYTDDKLPSDEKLGYGFKDNKKRRKDLKTLERLIKHERGLRRGDPMYNSYEPEGELVDEGKVELKRRNKNEMQRKAGNLGREVVSTPNTKKNAAKRGAAMDRMKKLVSAIARDDEEKRFKTIGQSPLHNSYEMEEGLDKKTFLANRKKNERKAATADARKRGHEGHEWHNTGRTYSPDEAKSRRANMSDDDRAARHRVAVDPDDDRDENTYSASKTKNPKKQRKQAAMGEMMTFSDFMESRRSEREGKGSPESPLSYPGRAIKKERGEKGGRHQHSGSVEYGGAAAERGRKKKDPYSQHQRLRNLSNYPEKPGKYSEKLRKKTDLGSRFD